MLCVLINKTDGQTIHEFKIRSAKANFYIYLLNNS